MYMYLLILYTFHHISMLLQSVPTYLFTNANYSLLNSVWHFGIILIVDSCAFPALDKGLLNLSFTRTWRILAQPKFLSCPGNLLLTYINCNRDIDM